VETFRRLGGDDVAATAARDFAEMTERSADEFNRICLYRSKTPSSICDLRVGPPTVMRKDRGLCRFDFCTSP
jgi:hypothetical protein